ncbi:MAG TPA: 2-oxoacid:acceptor oxidoreductase family protein [Candidatus Wallbacteria bacterium]|nr:2-oxoacid:acceptor oxidoreductase family protein [Candidatus Wallbacteria bacterium]
MISESINIAIGGEAGDGVLSAGEILCKVFYASGAGLCTYKNFPSRIRGGHTSYSIRITDDICRSRSCETDILIAFDEESFAFHNHELKDGAIVIRSGQGQKYSESFRQKRLLF